MRRLASALLIALTLPALGEEPPAPGVALKQALGSTLALDASIAAAARDVELFAGLAREARGDFDLRFEHRFSYERAQGELTERQLKAENDKRDGFRDVAAELGRIADDLERQLRETSGRPVPDCQDFVLVIEGRDVCLSDFRRSTSESFEDYLRTVIGIDPGSERSNFLETILRQQLDLLRQTFINYILELRNRQASLNAALRRLGTVPNIQKRHTLQFDSRLIKRYRTGIELSFGVILESVKDNFDGKRLEASLGGKGLPNTFSSFEGLELNLPLQKGFGRTTNAAAERAALLASEAARLDRGDVAARSALRTLAAYLRARAAGERQALLAESLATTQRLAAAGERLIASGEQPAYIRAHLAARRAAAEEALALARQEVLVGRLALGAAMGLELERASAAPLPSDPLPEPVPAAAIRALDGGALLTESLARRLDILALDKRREAALVVEKAAAASLKRRVDLSFALGMNGLYESFKVEFYQVKGFWKAISTKQTVPTGFLKLNIDLARKNDVARGEQLQAEALARQAEIAAADIKRLLAANLVELRGALAEAASEIAERRSALANLDAALEATITRFERGEASVVDTLLTEEQRTAARLAELGARELHAEILAQLHYETGLLVEGGEEGELHALDLRPATALGRSAS